MSGKLRCAQDGGPGQALGEKARLPFLGDGMGGAGCTAGCETGTLPPPCPAADPKQVTHKWASGLTTPAPTSKVKGSGAHSSQAQLPAVPGVPPPPEPLLATPWGWLKLVILRLVTLGGLLLGVLLQSLVNATHREC